MSCSGGAYIKVSGRLRQLQEKLVFFNCHAIMQWASQLLLLQPPPLICSVHVPVATASATVAVTLSELTRSFTWSLLAYVTQRCCWLQAIRIGHQARDGSHPLTRVCHDSLQVPAPLSHLDQTHTRLPHCGVTINETIRATLSSYVIKHVIGTVYSYSFTSDSTLLLYAPVYTMCITKKFYKEDTICHLKNHLYVFFVLLRQNLDKNN